MMFAAPKGGALAPIKLKISRFLAPTNKLRISARKENGYEYGWSRKNGGAQPFSCKAVANSNPANRVSQPNNNYPSQLEPLIRLRCVNLEGYYLSGLMKQIGSRWPEMAVFNNVSRPQKRESR